MSVFSIYSRMENVRNIKIGSGNYRRKTSGCHWPIWKFQSYRFWNIFKSLCRKYQGWVQSKHHPVRHKFCHKKPALGISYPAYVLAIIRRVSKNLFKKRSLRVAIKVITPTSDPNRVYREINFLRRSGKFFLFVLILKKPYFRWKM